MNLLRAGNRCGVTVVPMRLINCSDEDVFVLTENGPFLLDRFPYPTPIDLPSKGEHEPLELETIEGSATIDLIVNAPVTMTLYVPGPVEGTLYLVDAETLLRFPDRTDFVTPALYGTSAAGELDSVLVAVTRKLADVANTAVDVTDEMFGA